MNICGVTLKENGKVYYFDAGKLNVKKNLTVIVETERGLQFGKIVELNCKNVSANLLENIRPIIRISTKVDYSNYLKNLKDSAKALKDAKDKSQEMGLDMNIIDATYTFDRKQLVFNFVADERIDFREFVKYLAATYKTRIELHQIGVRDKAKLVGGIGSCGQSLCCTKFLSKMDTISINMAKNQNISLNPSKINGVCGRLLCCLQYEDDVYTDLRRNLPQIGTLVKTEFGKGEVIDVNVLKGSYIVLINNEKKEVFVDGSLQK